MLSIGLLALGLFVIGLFAGGCFSVGALTIGKYVAISDNAQAMIAIGQTQAYGSLFQKIGDLTSEEIVTVKHLTDANVPQFLSFAKEFFKFFSQHLNLMYQNNNM